MLRCTLTAAPDSGAEWPRAVKNSSQECGAGSLSEEGEIHA